MRHLCYTAVAVGLLAISGGVRPSLVGAQQKSGDVSVVKLDKLSAPVPAGWKSEKPANRLRKYQFKLPGAKDHPDAELTIMGESRPGTEKNFPTWKATFVPPEDKKIDDIAKEYKWAVPGATVNVLDITGTWKYKERPLDTKEKLLDDWRVIWVIFEEKDAKGDLVEAFHFRLSGPEVTIAEHAAAFEKWIKSFK